MTFHALSRITTLALASALCVAALAAQRKNASRKAPRAQWQVTCVDFEDEAYAEAGQAIAEAVGEVIFDALGGPREKAPELVLHLYRDPAAFEAAEQERTGGQFARNRAFSYRPDVTSHLVCEPFWPEPIRARLGLPGQVQHLIAHEAAHLAVYVSCKGRGAFHPDWFAEGFTQWAEVRALRKLGIVAGDPMEDPWFAESVRSVQALDDVPRVQEILDDDLDDLGFHPRYALQWLLVESASARAERPFSLLCQKVGAMHPQPRLKGDLGDKLLERLARGRSSRLDGWLGEHLAAQQPRWWEQIRSLAPAEVEGQPVLVQSSFGGKNAVAFRQGPDAATGGRPLEFACELVGKLDGHDGPPQLNVLLDRQDDSFLSVALHGSGWVTVFEHVYEGNAWNALGRGEAPMPTGNRFEVSIAIADGALAVSIDGTEAVRCEVERSWNGPWGVGAQAGSVGIWHQLTIE